MKKWFHLIGVSGKTTANIAKVFKQMGWFVTGSDNQFLPPASNILEDNKINIVEGFNFRHLDRDYWSEKLNEDLDDIGEHPDLVLFISHLTSKNKEYLYAKKLGLDIRPYSKILNEYLIKDESIVVAGTAGKTTTTALITSILRDLNLDPSYMVGADLIDFEDSLKITDSQFSVIEGDEYHNPDPEIEGKAKFLEYKPKYLVLTNIGWEHQDIFTTKERYLEEFGKLVNLVPAGGFIVASGRDESIKKVLGGSDKNIIFYSYVENEDDKNNLESGTWSVMEHQDSIFRIFNGDKEPVLEFETKLMGEYNLENILASVVVVLNLPSSVIPVDTIRAGTKNIEIIRNTIENFRGPKKRLEILFKSDRLVVVDDFGVAPQRAKNSLTTLSSYYPDYKIISVFEPNSASRPADIDELKSLYSGVFDLSSEVIIPELSNINDGYASSESLSNALVELGVNSNSIKNSEIKDFIEKRISHNSEDKYLVVFFSSYRLTNIAEEFSKR